MQTPRENHLQICISQPHSNCRLPTPVFLGFPCVSAGKESACNMGDLSSVLVWAGKHQLGNAAWGASFPSERALPAGGFGSVHTPSP